jgi:hypothetical protein
MHVTIEHVFAGIEPARYEAVYFDEVFNESLGRHLRMGRMLVRLDRTADRIVRHVRWEPSHAAGSEANQVFGTSRASFLEQLEYDTRTRRGEWRTVPNMFPERVKNSGTISIVADPAGTKRIVDGDAHVKLFGFGGRVEKMIVAEIAKSYEASAAFTREWLETH